jgi:hypothetical protein
MFPSSSRPGAPVRIAIAVDGANLVLDEETQANLAALPGWRAGAGGPALAAPFAGQKLLGWLAERIGDGKSVWSLRTLDGGRSTVLISAAGVMIERAPGDDARGDLTTKPVHELRNHLNIVQTTAELLGLTAEKTYDARLGEPISRILRQIPPMSAALETISIRERERLGSRHRVVDYLRGTIERTGWADRLVIESDSSVTAHATYCDAIARSAFEWASHELAKNGRARIGIAESSEQAALVFSGSGIGDWVLAGTQSNGRFGEWLPRWEDLDVSAGAWATTGGGGALIGIPR